MRNVYLFERGEDRLKPLDCEDEIVEKKSYDVYYFMWEMKLVACGYRLAKL